MVPPLVNTEFDVPFWVAVDIEVSEIPSVFRIVLPQPSSATRFLLCDVFIKKVYGRIT